MTADEIWDQGAAALRAQLAPATWAAWFHGVRPVEFANDVLMLSVPSSLAAERIRSSYSGMLTDAIRDVTGETVQLELLIETDVRDPVLGTTAPPLPLTETLPTPSPLGSPPADEAFATWASGTLNERYTFDQFVIGASNRFAHAAALSVAESPGRSYNPLFIYGPAGLGKTHLLLSLIHI